MTRKIGLMGGTFDPVHYGHLVLAEQARVELDLDIVYFIPSGNPPHKMNRGVTEGSLRREMVARAIADNEDFEVFDYELEQESYTYTIDTIAAVRDHIDPEASLFFITGADQVLQLESWKDYEKLLREVTFVAASRPGSDEEVLIGKVQALRDSLGVELLHLSIPALAISSSDIRERVRSKKSIRYLLPSDVEGFIKMNNLYL